MTLEELPTKAFDYHHDNETPSLATDSLRAGQPVPATTGSPVDLRPVHRPPGRSAISNWVATVFLDPVVESQCLQDSRPADAGATDRR